VPVPAPFSPAFRLQLGRLLLKVAALGDTLLVMTANLLSFAVLKYTLDKLREFLRKARDTRYATVRYTGVPIWRPWRDF
jgi:hypothetical protein